MTVDERYRERYKAGQTPWDVDRPDFNPTNAAKVPARRNGQRAISSWR